MWLYTGAGLQLSCVIITCLLTFDARAQAYVQSPGTLSSENALYVWHRAQSGTRGIQFQASWDVSPCFQRLTGTDNDIQSPGYPNQYPPNLNCTYEIVKRKGALLRFTFYTFTLGAQQNGVCQDALEIFDGDSLSSPSVGGPLCGTTRPSALATINQTTTAVLVRFTSDAVNTSVEQGYHFSWNEVEPDPIRPGNYTQDSGSFKTPGYPNVYNGEEDVIWTITTKPYKTITLSFQDVQLLRSLLDYISVADNTAGTYTSIGGPETTSTIVTDGNILEIRLMSSLDNGLNKFRASWTTECRQVFQSVNGIITSPNDPEFNTSSANCTYIIRQQPGYYIRIQFSSITFEKDAECKNFIEIHDGSTEFSPLLGEKYCGLSLPPPLNSTQNMVFMKFNTQTGYNNFSLTYSSHPKVSETTSSSTQEVTTASSTQKVTTANSTPEVATDSSTQKVATDSSTQKVTTDISTQVVTTNSSTQKVTTDSSTQKVTTDSSTQEVTTASSTQEVTTNSSTPEVATYSSTQKVTTANSTPEVATDSSTQKVTTDSSTQKVTTDSSTQEVTTNSSTQKVTTANSTPEVATDSSTQKATTDSSTQVVTTASSTQKATTDSSTQVVTTASSTQKVTTDSSTQKVATASSTQEVTTASSTQKVTTASSTQEVTTASSTQKVATASSTQEVTTASSTQKVTTDSSTQEVTSQTVGNTPELSTAIRSLTTTGSSSSLQATSVVGGTLVGVVAAAAMLMIVELKL